MVGVFGGGGGLQKKLRFWGQNFYTFSEKIELMGTNFDPRDTIPIRSKLCRKMTVAREVWLG